MSSIVKTINRVLGLVGVGPLSQKLVVQVITSGLTYAAVQLLPLGISQELNGLIVLVAGLVAHYLVPEGS
jgi:hypothetical protein